MIISFGSKDSERIWLGLEKLEGKSKDFYSIRINDQWRIVFRWENNNAYEVEILDYH